MTTPILVFANPMSGGGLADELMEELSNDESIHFVKLPEEAATFQNTYHDLLQDPTLRCLVAGGDGSVNWVVELLSKIFQTPESIPHRPPIAVYPLGTGNDMSRALGWGKGVKHSQIGDIQKQLTKIRRSNHIEKIDVWQITLKRTDTGEEVTKRMLNYFSIGVDAEICKNFEDFRNGCCGCCICCQCMSLTCYVPVALRSLCCKRPLKDYLTVDITDTSTNEIEQLEENYEDDNNNVENQSLRVNNNEIVRRLDAKSSEKTLVFQAITSIYAGRDLWIDKDARSMSDGRFEVVTEGGVFRLGFAQIGCKTSKPFCQGKKASIKADEPLYYQIDGEGYFMNGPSLITVDRIDGYPLIFAK